MTGAGSRSIRSSRSKNSSWTCARWHACSCADQRLGSGRRLRICAGTSRTSGTTMPGARARDWITDSVFTAETYEKVPRAGGMTPPARDEAERGLAAFPGRPGREMDDDDSQRTLRELSRTEEIALTHCQGGGFETLDAGFTVPRLLESCRLIQIDGTSVDEPAE